MCVVQKLRISSLHILMNLLCALSSNEKLQQRANFYVFWKYARRRARRKNEDTSSCAIGGRVRWLKEGCTSGSEIRTFEELLGVPLQPKTAAVTGDGQSRQFSTEEDSTQFNSTLCTQLRSSQFPQCHEQVSSPYVVACRVSADGANVHVYLHERVHILSRILERECSQLRITSWIITRHTRYDI